MKTISLYSVMLMLISILDWCFHVLEGIASPINQYIMLYPVNTSRPRQNGCYFTVKFSRGILLNENLFIFELNIIKIYSLGSNLKQAGTGLDNGLVPNRRQPVSEAMKA